MIRTICLNLTILLFLLPCPLTIQSRIVQPSIEASNILKVQNAQIQKQDDPKTETGESNKLKRQKYSLIRKILSYFKKISEQNKDRLKKYTEVLQNYSPSPKQIINGLGKISDAYVSSFLLVPRESFSQELQIQKIIKRMVVGGTTQTIATFAHETAHALVALWQGAPRVEVFIGDPTKPILATARIGPCIYALTKEIPPNQGRSVFYWPHNKKQTALQKLSRKMAGGIGGLTGLAILVFIKELYSTNNTENPSLKKKIFNATLKALKPKIWDINTIDQIYQMTSPEQGYDGAELWKFLRQLRCNQKPK